MRFSIIKREPAYFFENMQDDLNRFIKDMKEHGGEKFGKFWSPALEIRENKSEFKIKAELPGIDKQDIDVELHENYVAIKGETKHHEHKDDEDTHISEIRYGKFYRTIPLDSPIDVNDSKAEFNNGVLKITLRKQDSQEHEVKKLEIQ